ncbi:MAG: amidohydrolase family protein [Candidatus Tectimicrobiota bacterium]
MRTIDLHTHLVPQCLWRSVDAGQPWYGLQATPAPGASTLVRAGKQIHMPGAKMRFTPEQRLQDMDAEGTDVQVVSIHTPLFGYDLDPAQGRQLARDVNDEIAAMTRQWPQRFAGFATLPVQDVSAAIAELERAVTVLGLKGAELDTVANHGLTWDEPQFTPLFQAAEALGAVLFFHPQPVDNLLLARTDKYGISNSIGVPVEDALVVATLIFGGIFEACPALKVCIAHGGGPACFGMGRMDRGWQVRPEARLHIQQPPSRYQRHLYYDCVTNSEAALRFLIDQVGIDRVVLGSDWPFVHWDPSPGGWVRSLQSLTPEEKDKILWKNLEELLGL